MELTVTNEKWKETGSVTHIIHKTYNLDVQCRFVLSRFSYVAFSYVAPAGTGCLWRSLCELQLSMNNHTWEMDTALLCHDVITCISISLSTICWPMALVDCSLVVTV